ncbi:SOS response-associated peptidase family protein [Stenotrophomonas rhizophila]|uniref:SOS response-associated peptidase family protein n=1 Tax=Stenotrophomonas rhizophila TaxID=216778 RepID=UPI001869FF63|nr:SOS response-associated peptidase family protein [Stenotrophomonas rhizophila]
MPPVDLCSSPVLVPVNLHLSPNHAHGVTGALSDGPLRPDRRQPLWAAGLWEDASKLLGDDDLGSFTVITGDSNGVSADIHDRMPVWLAADQAKERMTAVPDDAMAMLLASETPAMKAY